MQLLRGRNKLAFTISLSGLLWVGAICWTRWVLTPEGFLSMLFGLLALHIASFLSGLANYFKQPELKLKTTNLWLMLVLLCSFNSGIIFGCHLFKDKWFGFSFYYIPSESMYPTLKAGDIVLVDSWAYSARNPKLHDIPIFKRSEKGTVLVKRLTNVQIKNGKSEFFVEGDNQRRSYDSRHFGWVENAHLIGKVKFIWFSFSDTQRFLALVS